MLRELSHKDWSARVRPSTLEKELSLRTQKGTRSHKDPLGLHGSLGYAIASVCKLGYHGKQLR